MEFSKIHPLRFALAAGCYGALLGIFVTASAMFGLPGFVEFAKQLESFYGPWGYSVSWSGACVGALYGFQEGFVHLGLLALIYNKFLAIGVP